MPDTFSKTIPWNKSLRTKTFLALVSGVAILVATLYLAGQFYLVKSFEELERREGAATMERVRQAVQEQENFLLTKAQDWAYWDDAYKFVQDGNAAFKTSNLTDNALGNLKIHILVYLNAKNEVVSFLQGNSEDFKPAQQSKGADLFIGSKSPYLNWGDKIEGGVSGIVMLPEGPALIVSRPVITSELKGPVAGTLIFGQYVDKNLVKRLSELTNLNLELADLGSATDSIYTTLNEKNPVGLVVKDSDNIAGYSVFQDIFGKPAIGLWSLIPRELMKKGLQSISLFTNIVAGLGLLFILLMVFIIDRAMVARLIGLSGEVANIAPDTLNSGGKGQVNISGTDEVGLLAHEINDMLSTIAKHSQAMTDIVDNVSFGFFICDTKGAIRPGLTKSCGTLLGWDMAGLAGKAVIEAFRMKPKDGEWFMTLYNQLCEDIFPEETSLSQMPNRFVVSHNGDHRVVRLDGRVLRDKSQGAPRGVLFSITDITELERAEIENQEAKTLLKILQAPTAFGDFIAEMKSQVKVLSNSISTQNQKTTRRILHTLKGNFSCFGLELIARELHIIEDRTEITQTDVATIENLARSFLNKNKAVLRIDYDQPTSTQYTLSDQDLERMERIGFSTQLNLEQKNNAIHFLVADLRRKSASELIGPLDDMVQQTATKLGKTIQFEFVGGETRVDPGRFKAVSDILPHLIRNSIDHGLEQPEEREDNGKSSVGSIILSIKTSAASAMAPESQDGLLVTLKDDGRGINVDRVANKALQMGIVSESELAAMSLSQKSELIFLDALSTASEVSEISGRGFGMSAVKDSIAKIGGTVTIENSPGKGCSFTLFIPNAVEPAFRVKPAA